MIQSPKPADYSATHFQGAAVNLFELFKANLLKTGQPVIADRTFTDCVVEGPAVLLALSGVRFDGCDLGHAHGDPRNLILMPMSKSRVTGAIALRDCVFSGCRFHAVGYTGSDAFIDQLLQGLGPVAGRA